MNIIGYFRKTQQIILYFFVTNFCFSIQPHWRRTLLPHICIQLLSKRRETSPPIPLQKRGNWNGFFQFKYFFISFFASIFPISLPFGEDRWGFFPSLPGTDRRGFYLSISGITKSRVPIIATRSPNLPPLAILSKAERLENPGERNLIR